MSVLSPTVDSSNRAQASVRPLRVLHAVAEMRPGGIESWLMEVLRRIDRERYALDFLVHVDQPRQFDPEIQSLGGRVIPCLNPQRPWEYAANFRRACAAHGPYDVVHSHMHHYSGFILKLAARQGVPVRIAHSHTDDRPNVAAASWARRRYVDLMRRWLERHATLGLGCSRNAVEALFGRGWQTDGRWRVYYCGIDLNRFASAFDADALRTDLKVPPGRRVIGHVGRFEPLKNHALIVRTAQQMVRTRDDLHFLFVGEGDSRPQVEALVAELGLTDRFTFAGARSDVPRILNGVVDALMFPSEREGLPMAVVEAQTAGIPLVISDVITNEVEVLAPLVRRLSLQAPPAEWAAALLTALELPRTDRTASRRAIEESPFNIVAGVRELERMYRDGCP